MNKEHYEVLERFYADCLKFWERENVENPKEKALADVRRIETNPFIFKNSPRIDTATKEEFIKSID